jgi:hypothetical protein
MYNISQCFVGSGSTFILAMVLTHFIANENEAYDISILSICLSPR